MHVRQPCLEIAVRLDETAAKDIAAGKVASVQHRSTIDPHSTANPGNAGIKPVPMQQKSDAGAFARKPASCYGSRGEFVVPAFSLLNLLAPARETIVTAKVP